MPCSLPLVFDVFIDEASDGEGGEGVAPAGGDRQPEVQQHAQDRQRPVVIAEPAVVSNNEISGAIESQSNR